MRVINHSDMIPLPRTLEWGGAMDVSRRSILITGATLGAVGVNVTANFITKFFLDEIEASKNELVRAHEARRLAQSITFDIADVCLIPGLSHVQTGHLTDERRSSNIKAATSLAHSLGFGDRDWLCAAKQTVESLAPQMHKNIIAVGSPTSNLVSRSIFGYRGDAGGGHLVKQPDPPLIDLPIKFALDPREDGYPRTEAKRYKDGKVKKIGNWSVVWLGKVMRPMLDTRGLLASDYLIVTRIPNLFSQEGIQAGRAILNVAGAHGIATEAIELLLCDKDCGSSTQQVEFQKSRRL
ncbi:MAG: hypothetical protein AB1744_15555 [Candidatus Zixiibacteriota bacterium]